MADVQYEDLIVKCVMRDLTVIVVTLLFLFSTVV